MNAIDTHAHVFSQHDQCSENARYTPNYDATAEQFIAHLDQHHFRYGVLIQPSFLGTNNQAMLAAIQQYPDRLKGIAVVEHTATLEELVQLKAHGIVGIRLNLFGQPLPDLDNPQWQNFLGYLEVLEWQIELHAPPAYLVAVLPQLNHYNLNIVIDHFGRVDPVKGIDDADYQSFLTLLDAKKHWVKVSGFYRLTQDPATPNIAQQAFKLLKEKGMLKKMVWGSDWPHTQHEAKISYENSVDAFKQIVPDSAEQKMILMDNALQLFKF